MGSNCLCLGCGKNYAKGDGVRGRYCSNECKLRYPKKKKKCQPNCKDENLRIREVLFKDQGIHTQQYCLICKRVTYLPKGTSKVEKIDKSVKMKSEFLKQKYGESFYSSIEWLKLRWRVLTRFGAKCRLCNITGVEMHVDHIKPRSKFPELSLKEDNLQVLCKDCNMGKSNQYEEPKQESPKCLTCGEVHGLNRLCLPKF